jgi:uncharacterized membrane protein YqaE (UPF0057 family)
VTIDRVVQGLGAIVPARLREQLTRGVLSGERVSDVLYVIAIILPPVAVLLAGKPGQALLNVPLTLFGYVPGVIHALLVARSYYEDKHAETLLPAGPTASLVPAGFEGPVMCRSCGGFAARTAVACPHCDAEFVEQPDPTKVCPQCAETIKAAARMCRFCRFTFPAPSQGATRWQGVAD